MLAITVLFGVLAIPTVVVTMVVGHRFPGWSAYKVVLLSAAAVPSLIAALAVVLFANAALSPAEKCGVDACGMAMAVAVYLMAAAVAGYLGCVLVAWSVYGLTRVKRDERGDLDETFR